MLAVLYFLFNVPPCKCIAGEKAFLIYIGVEILFRKILCLSCMGDCIAITCVISAEYAKMQKIWCWVFN
ncbi:MAG: hypothetical protein KKC75_02560 [Nanoarchaeota archaeon]|nr:hypothetical protein [Nanoarchaeota archaeon]MBU1946383.1 hypothetical protein [Nanoarchaeota archaeon]